MDRFEIDEEQKKRIEELKQILEAGKPQPPRNRAERRAIRNIISEFQARIGCSKRSGRLVLLNDDIDKLHILIEAANKYIDLCDWGK